MRSKKIKVNWQTRLLGILPRAPIELEIWGLQQRRHFVILCHLLVLNHPTKHTDPLIIYYTSYRAFDLGRADAISEETILQSSVNFVAVFAS